MRLDIRSDGDIIGSRSIVREMAKDVGFSMVDQTKIATAVSELARNAIKYAGAGVLIVEVLEGTGRRGIEIVCEDKGPGIGDIEAAMRDGYSTSRGLGKGLSGTKGLMDEFEITSEPGRGSRIVIRKWL